MGGRGLHSRVMIAMVMPVGEVKSWLGEAELQAQEPVADTEDAREKHQVRHLPSAVRRLYWGLYSSCSMMIGVKLDMHVRARILS